MNIGSIGQVVDLYKPQDSKSLISDKDFKLEIDKAITNKDDEKLMESCKEMEKYFIGMLYKQMKTSTLSGEQLIEKGDYEEMFEGQLIDEQAKVMTDAGGIGLAKMMYEQMKNNR